MIFDLDAALRLLKPQKRSRGLKRRPDVELKWADDASIIGGPVFLDTTVYLDVLQGRSPQTVDRLVTARICHHSAVCLAELTHAFGRLDPAHPSTTAALETLRSVIVEVPSYRCHAPDTAVWGQAGILAGTLFRLSGRPAKQGHERKALNDSLLFLQARLLGCAVLTGNIEDFDFLTQLVPSGNIILYRCEASPSREPA